MTDGALCCQGVDRPLEKWAVRGMTKAVAMELSPRGIRMASIHPGFVLTHLVTVEGVSPYAVRASLGALSERLAPLGRAGRPEDILRLGLAERLSS